MRSAYAMIVPFVRCPLKLFRVAVALVPTTSIVLVIAGNELMPCGAFLVQRGCRSSLRARRSFRRRWT